MVTAHDRLKEAWRRPPEALPRLLYPVRAQRQHIPRSGRLWLLRCFDATRGNGSKSVDNVTSRAHSRALEPRRWCIHGTFSVVSILPLDPV